MSPHALIQSLQGTVRMRRDEIDRLKAHIEALKIENANLKNFRAAYIKALGKWMTSRNNLLIENRDLKAEFAELTLPEGWHYGECSREYGCEMFAHCYMQDGGGWRWDLLGESCPDGEIVCEADGHERSLHEAIAAADAAAKELLEE